MLDDRFSYDNLVASPDRPNLLEALRAEITRRLQTTSDPEKEGYVVVEELRKLGHDLWSFDESDDFQRWCGDWVNPKHPYELFLEISYGEGELPCATVTFRERRKENR
jgi:hypothetical protein